MEHLTDAPVANLLILAGIIFLAVGLFGRVGGFLGKIFGAIEAGQGARVLSGCVGLALVIGGVVLHSQVDSSKPGQTTAVNEPAPPITPKPVIESFSVAPSKVTKGGMVTIRWRVSNADYVELENFGQVDAAGSTSDQPQQSTVYTLNASNKGGKDSKWEKVMVEEAPRSPEPQPFPKPQPTGGQVTSCAPTYPTQPLLKGRRVLFVTSSDGAVEGAEIDLNGRCQGTIRREAPGREQFSLMLVNIPPANYRVRVRKKGFRVFLTDVAVPPSDRPAEMTPKVVVRFDLTSQ